MGLGGIPCPKPEKRSKGIAGAVPEQLREVAIRVDRLGDHLAAETRQPPAEEICRDCGLPILSGQETATVCSVYEASAYRVHRRCGKLATAQSRKVETETCPNCHQQRPKGETCFQCGIGPRIGAPETPPRPDLPALDLDDLGLSIDMLAADRLREWARLLLVHGADISHWGSVPHVASKMQIMATEIEKAVRDIGTLRAERLRAVGPRPESLIAIIEALRAEAREVAEGLSHDGDVKPEEMIHWELADRLATLQVGPRPDVEKTDQETERAQGAALELRTVADRLE